MAHEMAERIKELYATGVLDELSDGIYFVDRDRKILYWNKAAERLSGFSATDMVGTHCYSDVLAHVDDEGRVLCTDGCPLHRAIELGLPTRTEVFLRHRDGHRIPVIVRVTPLRDAAGRIVGAFEVFTDNSFVASLRQRMGELTSQALLDPLTAIPNRRFIENTVRVRQDELVRFGWPYGVFFADIDHFKDVNDKHGHDSGDAVLRAVSQTFVSALRPFDSAGRWGGEEFVGVIANVDLPRLEAACNRVMSVVRKTNALTSSGRRLSITMSMGATLAHPDDVVNDVISRADSLMYESKVSGRDRLTMG